MSENNVQSLNINSQTKPELLSLINVENCIKIAEKMDFEIYENKPNIWGVRVPKGVGFNDVFIIFWQTLVLGQKEPVWKSIITNGTTEPSATYLSTLFASGKKNRNGIAILVPDKQYVDCWVFGKHKGKYDALQQYWRFKFPCYRKKKDEADYYSGYIYYDVQGLNFHTTRWGYTVDKILGWSEGCQVIFDASLYFNKIIPLLRNYYRHKYTYTLVNDTQFYNLVNT
jgi:hypothetical protein